MFTPGPWQAHIRNGAPSFVTREGDIHGWICSTLDWYGQEQQEANARLIAAAPDLAAAVEAYLREYDGPKHRIGGIESARTKLRAALAKAVR